MWLCTANSIPCSTSASRQSDLAREHREVPSDGGLLRHARDAAELRDIGSQESSNATLDHGENAESGELLNLKAASNAPAVAYG